MRNIAVVKCEKYFDPEPFRCRSRVRQTDRQRDRLKDGWRDIVIAKAVFNYVARPKNTRKEFNS